jgi:3-hydroxymyristoyl/3-hydroxydecanoyl-(acyl carrier protein) dehydratase
MQKRAAQLDSLRRRLALSPLLADLSLEPVANEVGAVAAKAMLSAEGHDLVAAAGTTALLDTLNGDDADGRIAWRFTTGAADPWPDGIKRNEGMLPRLWSWLPNGDEHRLLLEVSDDLRWVEGHFPRTPILAGVVQLHWAALLARGVFGLSAFPHDIVRLKFQRPVLPPAVLELRLQRIDELNVQFGFRSPGHAHSQGRLLFGAEDR